MSIVDEITQLSYWSNDPDQTGILRAIYMKPIVNGRLFELFAIDIKPTLRRTHTCEWTSGIHPPNLNNLSEMALQLHNEIGLLPPSSSAFPAVISRLICG
jgi:hypothetical protein